MQLPKIRTFNTQLKLNQPHFFILSRGLNSGKPSNKPWTNSFVCICTDEKERDFYYWLLFGLWKAKFFVPHLVGSVIPLIRIYDLKAIIEEQALAVRRHEVEFMQAIEKIKLIEAKEAQIHVQLNLLQSLKRSLIHVNLKH